MAGSDGVKAVAPPSGTVTFLFTDIEGSTRHWARHRSAMEAALRVHDVLMRGAIEAHDGHVFKTVGDAFCAAFATPESAVSAAIDAQRALGDADFSAVGSLRVRMALNTGTADERDGDYFGPTVNRVARLLSLGHGGQVLLSGIAAGLLRETLPPDAKLSDLGAHVLKDLDGREQVYQLAAPRLRRDFPALRTPKTGRQWLVPEAMHTHYFTGRNTLLAGVRTQLVERRRAALCGLGGVGKTQAAIEYAMRHRADYPGGVYWVNADTTNGFTSGFVEIAKALEITTAQAPDQEQDVKAVLEWLNATDGWLLILDNLDDRRAAARFVPQSKTGHVLITTRESVLAELGIPRALEVRDLDRDEAVAFLLRRTGRDTDDTDERTTAEHLAAELGNLPLALEQAAAYIAETNASFSAYLLAYLKRRVTLLEKASGLVAHDTVASTWEANFAAVEAISPACAEIVRISAFLAPDAIPFEIFAKGAQILGGAVAEVLSDPDELAMAEMLRPLARYSLIRSDERSRTFSVHRLVQEVVRAAIGESERKRYVERAVEALNAAFPEIQYARWAPFDQLVPHVAAIARWLDAYDLYPARGLRILSGTALYLIDRGRYDEAKALLQRALVIAERTLGPDDPAGADPLNSLALVYLYQGKYRESRAVFERALAIRERALGPEHAHVASTLNNMANAYLFEGTYDKAQPLYERALSIWEKTRGPDDPAIATGLNNLAEVLTSQGRYGDVRAMHERALAIRERALGHDHAHVALSLSNLAELAAKQGRDADAQTLNERALAIRERTLGPDHEDVAVSLTNLATVHENFGRFEEARPMHERALAISERALGPQHPGVAHSVDGLAGLCFRQGRYAQAEALYERALAIREHAFGPDHPETCHTLVGLAQLRQQQGRRTEAAEIFARALAIKERIFPAEDLELVQIRSSLASLRSDSAPAE